jgi:alpha-1,6-mannosyltransferase
MNMRFDPLSALSEAEQFLFRTAQPDGKPVRLVDTTMLYAPRSGGVRRYLNSKRTWIAANRPQVRHTLVVPGPRDAHDGHGRVSIYAAPCRSATATAGRSARPPGWSG